MFCEQCKVYLNECTGVHEHRHDAVTYIAQATSVRDLIEQVAKKCPEGTPILSEQCMTHLQFLPKISTNKTALQCTKQFPVKMIQDSSSQFLEESSGEDDVHPQPRLSEYWPYEV